MRHVQNDRINAATERNTTNPLGDLQFPAGTFTGLQVDKARHRAPDSNYVGYVSRDSW